MKWRNSASQIVAQKRIPVPITPVAPCKRCLSQAQGHFHRELLEEGLAWSGSQPGAAGKTEKVVHTCVLEAHGHWVYYVYLCDEANFANAKQVIVIMWLDQLCFANAPYDHYVLHVDIQLEWLVTKPGTMYFLCKDAIRAPYPGGYTCDCFNPVDPDLSRSIVLFGHSRCKNTIWITPILWRT